VHCDEHACLCLSVRHANTHALAYQELSSLYYLCMLLMAVAHFRHGGVAVRLRYVLPVLWMTSYSHIMKHVDTVDVIASSQVIAPAAPYWLRRVPDDGWRRD